MWIGRLGHAFIVTDVEEIGEAAPISSADYRYDLVSVQAAAPKTSKFAATTGDAPMNSPYATHISAPSICICLSAEGRQKYDPTKTAVAVHPRYSINDVLLQATASMIRAVARTVIRSVRAFSHSWSVSPFDSNHVRI